MKCHRGRVRTRVRVRVRVRVKRFNLTDIVAKRCDINHVLHTSISILQIFILSGDRVSSKLTFFL